MIRHPLISMILGVALLLSIHLLIRTVSAAENGVISFVSEGNSDIYLIDTQGQIRRRIATGLGNVGRHLTWAPDQRFFAYASFMDGGNKEIYVMDIRTKLSHSLTRHPSRDSRPAWSPDGRWIAFISNRAGNSDIYRMDVNGKQLMRLTNQGDSGRPAWSPDSQWIAFDSHIGVDHGAGLLGRHFISVMTADGRKLRNLIENVSLWGKCTWSPDGKQIAFTAATPIGIDIFVIELTGKNLRNLTQLDVPAIADSPAWSPDGKWIAYILAARPPALQQGRAVLWDDLFRDSVLCLIDVEGGTPGKPLEATRGLIFDHAPEWMSEAFFSISPSAELQTTLWGELKQTAKDSK